MKVELLKKLIKESVREVFQEEIKDILYEMTVSKTKKDITLTSESTPSTSNTPPKTVRSSNPVSQEYTKNKQLNEILNSTRMQMTNEDFSMINSSGNVEIPNVIGSSNQPGIDITKLDFVKNASNIFKQSVKADKLRNGI